MTCIGTCIVETLEIEPAYKISNRFQNGKSFLSRVSESLLEAA